MDQLVFKILASFYILLINAPFCSIFGRSNRTSSLTVTTGVTFLFCPRGYYGSVRNYGAVRLRFGNKYHAELRTEFLEKVRYGNTVYFPYSSNARFALLFPSTATFFLLAYNFTTSVALTTHNFK